MINNKPIHTLSVYVSNKPGVLARIAQTFGRIRSRLGLLGQQGAGVGPRALHEEGQGAFLADLVQGAQGVEERGGWSLIPSMMKRWRH